MTITTDTTLHEDLRGCPGNGILIGADGVTLDLNGHSISGDGVPQQPCEQGEVCDVGVVNVDGHARTVVRDGSVTNFAVGILFVGADRSRVSHVRVRRTANVGIVVAESVHPVVRRARLVDTGTSGLVVADSRHAVVARNRVAGNHGFGVIALAVHHSRVQRNVLSDNDHGIGMQAGSSRNLVGRNVVRRSGGSAIDVGGDGAVRNRVVRNRLLDNGDGLIFGDANRTIIVRNVVTGTGTSGFPDAGGFGLRLDGSDRNRISRNVITGGRGIAITVTSEEFPTLAVGNVLSRNVANSTDEDGIRVDTGARHTVITRNTSHRNADDGIDITSPSTRVGRNHTDHNNVLGIRAVPGVTDAGGNQAHGNGDPDQCLNVACH